MTNSDIAIQLSPHLTISNFLSTEKQSELVQDILAGLKSDPKNISSRFFYDDKGSSLFETITALPEYYPTRTETSILKSNAKNILNGYSDLDIVELGSGDCTKISILLDAIPEHKMAEINYIPIDVSKAAILKSAEILSQSYPGLSIHGLLADFLKHLERLPGKRNRLICFFGSTLGNLTRKHASEFLMNLKGIMNPGDRLLLGLDMVKDVKVLHKAYNDTQGITNRFNKNILNVLNNTIQTNFVADNFEHHAFYNKQKARIEMYLKALNSSAITSPLFNETIHINTGELIHTENSHKFTLHDVYTYETLTGLKLNHIYSDDNQWFSLVDYVYA